MKLSTEDVKQQVQDALASDVAAVSERVRAITLRVLSSGKLDTDSLKQVMATVIGAARQHPAGRTERDAQALKEAVKGLDEALAMAADATRLAIEEAASRSGDFSRQGLKQAVDDLAAIESLLVETLSDAARNTTGVVQATLRDLAEHARASGTAAGERVEAALSQFARTFAESARDRTVAGTQVLRNEAALFAELAAGVLRGIADRLHSPDGSKSAPPSSDNGS